MAEITAAAAVQQMVMAAKHLMVTVPFALSGPELQDHFLQRA
jgi:hypothetical protein